MLSSANFGDTGLSTIGGDVAAGEHDPIALLKLLNEDLASSALYGTAASSVQCAYSASYCSFVQHCCLVYSQCQCIFLTCVMHVIFCLFWPKAIELQIPQFICCIDASTHPQAVIPTSPSLKSFNNGMPNKIRSA